MAPSVNRERWESALQRVVEGEIYLLRHPKRRDPKHRRAFVVVSRTIHCDELVSLPKSARADYVGALSSMKLGELNDSLRVALALDR